MFTLGILLSYKGMPKSVSFTPRLTTISPFNESARGCGPYPLIQTTGGIMASIMIEVDLWDGTMTVMSDAELEELDEVTEGEEVAEVEEVAEDGEVSADVEVDGEAEEFAEEEDKIEAEQAEIDAEQAELDERQEELDARRADFEDRLNNA
jgi:hypothetical protein